MKKKIFYLLALAVIMVIGCQKELSFEGSNTPAKGSLQAEISGDCLPKTVNGSFIAGTALVPATNTIAVQVNVARTGTYTVYTDTVNGYYFRATGTFTTLGLNTVTLRSNGTPFAAGINNFVVNFYSTVCDIQVTVLPVGSTPAKFTLVNGGTPVNCASTVVTGTYVGGGTLAATTHYVDITVNVTTVGIYTIKATGGGMTFQKTGTFAATGNTTVRLNGSGTAPAAGGPATVTFDPPFASCNFTVTVVASVAGTLGGGPGACTPVVISGAYTKNIALTASNKVRVTITTASIGPYSITTAPAVDGLVFTATGISSGGPQTVNLIGTGTPVNAGTQNFIVKFGTSTCTFALNVQASLAAYTIDCPNVLVHGIYTVGVPLNAADYINIPVTVTTAGSYDISVSVNGMSFSATGTLPVGPAVITLVGNIATLPTGPAGVKNLVVGACTIPITVAAVPTIDWSFTTGATTYKGTTDAVDYYDNTIFPPFTVIDYYGSNFMAEDINLRLADPSGGLFTTNEQYNSNITTVANGGYFYFFGANMELEATDPATTPGVNITFIVTSHNTTTRTIIGTFSGMALDHVSNTNMTITNGNFTMIY